MIARKQSELQPHQAVFAEAKFRALVAENPGDFGAWTSLITEVEKTTPNDIQRICQVYDSFLSEFPLCYGYWKKYADHMVHLCTIDKVVEVYERAVQLAAYSVGLWVNYCSFGMLSFEDPVDVRRLFERGISFVGKDYLCHLLWDKYIEFEYSQKQWSHLAHIYIRTLRFPTKKLNSYYGSFKKLAAIWEEDVKCQDKGTTEAESESECLSDVEITDIKAYDEKEISFMIEDLLDPPAGLPRPDTLKKFLSAGEHFYRRASGMDAKIKGFESRIRRPYFHIKLLDDIQLENWHHYLDFIELQGDFDWAVKLYERGLIPCANYPEFWIRYVEFVEAKGGREIANAALDRATEVFLKRVPGIHLFCAMFKERIGDTVRARAAFLPCSPDSGSHFIENVTRKANMEKRSGNVESASIIYEKAIDMAKEKQNPWILSLLYAHFSRFTYTATGNIDAARDILIKGIQHLPPNKLLLKRLIHFEMMHGGPRKIDIIDSVVAQATAPQTNVYPGFSTDDCEEISNLFLEFVDLCGTVHEIKKAWDRHRKIFPYQMRPTSSCNESVEKASGNISLGKAKLGREENLVPLLHHASGDDSTQGQNQHTLLNTSLQKTTDLQSDQAATDQSEPEKTNNDSNDSLQQVQSAEVVQEHTGLDATIHHVGVCDSVQEFSNTNPQSPVMPQEYPVSTEKVQMETDHEPQDDLRPPALETLSINPQEDETQQSTPTTSVDRKALDTTSTSYINKPQDDTDGISSKSNPTCTQTETPAQMHVQTQEEAQSQRTVPMSGTFQHNVDTGGSWQQTSHAGQSPKDLGSHGYAQAQQPQQWQASPQQQYSQAEMHSRMLAAQGYPYPQQPWQVLQVQQANQQYQAAAAQAYWPAQNMQQQNFASVPQAQQSVPTPSHPQAQAYQYPVQSYPGFDSQMWYYYQQQQLQQQQQQQQQLQLQPQLQQQQLHPQMHLQQQQGQQHQLQQQQLQTQLQQQQEQQQLQLNPQQQQQLHLQQQQLQQHQLQLQQQLQQQQLQQHQQQTHQQTTPSQIQTWNGNYYPQGQVAGQPNGEPSERVSSEPQQKPPSSQ